MTLIETCTRFTASLERGVAVILRSLGAEGSALLWEESADGHEASADALADELRRP